MNWPWTLARTSRRASWRSPSTAGGRLRVPERAHPAFPPTRPRHGSTPAGPTPTPTPAADYSYAPDPLPVTNTGFPFKAGECWDLDTYTPVIDTFCDLSLDNNGILTPKNLALISGTGRQSPRPCTIAVLIH